MNINSNSVPGRILVYSTFAVILTIGLRELAPILTAIFFSIFAALIITPLVRWLKRKGILGGLSERPSGNFLFALIVMIPGVVVVGAEGRENKMVTWGDQKVLRSRTDKRAD